MIMASPPFQRLWAVMLLAVTAELPGALEKCIFDEVQSRVRVVTTTPTHQDGPPSETWPSGAPARQEVEHTQSSGMDESKYTPPGQNASPQQIPSQNRMLRELAPHIRDTPQPIRIRTWVPRESSLGLSPAERARLEPSVAEAVGVVSSLLSVNRVPGRLLLSRDVNKYCRFRWRNSSTANYNRCGRANENYRNETCLDVIIPDDHLGSCAVYPQPDSPIRTVLRPEGAGLPDADFLLYLHTWRTDKCKAEPSVLAYAVHCQTDSQGRPVAGVVVICRDRLTGERYSHQATVQAVIHELLHALGFSKDLFSTWRDCSSSSQAGVGCPPRGQVTNTDGRGQRRIYTQSVISALQNHLASTDPELGGPLENLDVGAGGVSSHWESRVLQGSIMAAALSDPAAVRIDPVTLAALEDTGWYAVNLSRAQSLVWGEGEGAMFGSLSTCQDNSSSFFCSGSGLGCHYLHLHKGECQTDQYLEGCRVYKPLTNRSECWREENDIWSVEEDLGGEIYGLDSRCFFSNLTRENQSVSLSGSVAGRCYKHRCTGPNRYHIQVSGSEWTDCPAGGTIQVSGYQGLVFCPNRRLCQYPDINPPKPAVASTTGPLTTNDSYQRLTSDPSESVSSSPPAAVPRRPTDPTVAAVLGVIAAVSLLAAVMATYRKYRASRVRVHAGAPQDPGGRQVQYGQSLSKEH